mgnify:CR=1 FL=1
MNRRDMLKVAGTAIAGATLLGAEAFANEPTTTPQKTKKALIEEKTPEEIYVKDVIDDVDASDGLIFNRWYADISYMGIAIDWEEML